MPVVYLLVMFLPGLSSPVSTGQRFESKAACEAAVEALQAADTTLRYACQATDSSE